MRSSSSWDIVVASLLLLWLLFSRSAAPASPVAGRIALTLRAQASAGTITRSVGQNDVVYSGERLELYVRLDRDAYVYVVILLADGSDDVLFPKVGDKFISANSEVRIPDTGQDLELDETPGEERLYVISSSQPLAKADPAFAEALRQIRTAAAATRGAPAPPPRPNSQDTRGSKPSTTAGPGATNKSEPKIGTPQKPALTAQSPVPVSQTPAPLASDVYSWQSKGIRVVPSKDSSVNRADAQAGSIAIFALTLQHRHRRAPARP